MNRVELAAAILIEALFFGTWAAIAAAVVWLRARIRSTPIEVLQYRIFEQHRQLATSLTFIAAGTFGGILSHAPFTVAIQPPLAWPVVWTAVWAFGLPWGFVSLARAYTVPIQAGPRRVRA